METSNATGWFEERKRRELHYLKAQMCTHTCQDGICCFASAKKKTFFSVCFSITLLASESVK